MEQVGHCQHFCAFRLEAVAAVAGDHAGMVVVFDVQHIPALAVQLLLPLGVAALQLAEVEGHVDVVGHEAVRFLCGELDHHVQYGITLLMDEFQGLFGGQQGGFRKGHAVVVIEYVPLELLQIFVEMGAVVEHEDALGGGHEPIVGETLGLGNEGDDVLTEAVYAHVQPEAENVLHFFTNQRIVHVQIRLLDGEQVHIVFLSHLVPLPCLTLKQGIPVVGQLAARFCGAPDIVIGVGVDTLTALLEPFVLHTGVVDHQVHDDLHAPRVGTVQHFFEGFHAAEFGGNVVVVGDVIAAVHPGGGIERGEPDAVAAQRLDIIQLLVDPVQVAHAVAVAVLEGTGPNLIEHHVLVPLLVCHRQSLLA